MCSLHPVSLNPSREGKKWGPATIYWVLATKQKMPTLYACSVFSWRICRACSQLCSFPIALLPSAADCNKTLWSQLTQLGNMIELPHVSHLHFQTDCMLSPKISSTQMYSISSYRGADLWVQSCTQPCCLIAFLLQDWINLPPANQHTSDVNNTIRSVA